MTKKHLFDLDKIIANLPECVYWKDLNGLYQGCNEMVARLAGFSSPQEIVNLSDYDIAKKLGWDDSVVEPIVKADREIMATGLPKLNIEEKALKVADGSIVWQRSSKVPIFDEEGKVAGVFGISFDITDLKDSQEKLEGMTLVSGSIAHELRTPLASLNISSALLNGVFKKYTDAGSGSCNINPSDLNLIRKELASLEKEVKASFTFIDMLLLNLSPTSDISRIESIPISKCIEDALSRYPYIGKQHELVNWTKEEANDFEVRVEPMLLTHVLFNLLKNALYYVAEADKGDIQIYLEKGYPFNKLYFKDTGTGIPSGFVPHVFNRFVSNTYHGAGLGLTFCRWVMESLGGKIVCESVEGDYTLFVLSFPNLSTE